MEIRAKVSALRTRSRRSSTLIERAEAEDPGASKLRYGGMWILQSSETEIAPLTFRVKPGAIKTVGRAPRAGILVGAENGRRAQAHRDSGDGRHQQLLASGHSCLLCVEKPCRSRAFGRSRRRDSNPWPPLYKSGALTS